jgi:hypothetical protein
LSEWVYIKKGDRHPEGDVLVARLYDVDTPEARLKAAIFGFSPESIPIIPVVTVAHWHKGRKKWVFGPRGEEVRNVYAWMPMPEAPPPPPSA